jgi:S-adenosylmethionine-diacylgycerolhomoserine-N-methlytransferase
VTLAGYYRVHAGIYDQTRWSFLFGRRALLEELGGGFAPRSILEVGCGTGTNLRFLASRFSGAELHGLDLSPHMLARARRKLSAHRDRVHLLQGTYPEDAPLLKREGRFDLVLFSYSLSMFQPDWRHALSSVRGSLLPRGRIAVVDFHDSPHGTFKAWMKVNHVRMDSRLLPALENEFSAQSGAIRPVFLGAWTYFTFIGS